MSGKMIQAAKSAETFMAGLELVLLAVVGRLATWAAPLPSALLVGRALGDIFGLGGAGPWVMAAVVELVGLAASNLWLTAKEWNATKRKSDPEANERLALGLLSFYFVVVMAILGALEIPPALQGNPSGLVSLLFPGLSVVAILALNERAAQSKRQAAIDAEVAQREQKRAETRSEKAKLRLELEKARLEAEAQQERARLELEKTRLETEARQRELEAQQTKVRRRAEAQQRASERRQTLASLGQTTKQTLDLLATDPTQTQTDLADVLGIKPQSVAYHIDRLESLGLIDRDGPTGIKVLVDVGGDSLAGENGRSGSGGE